MEIVGVVPGLRHTMFDRSPIPHVYLPFGRNYRAGMTVHVKLAGGGRPAEVAALRAVREELRAIDERLPVLMLKTLEEFRESTIYLWMARAGAKFFTTFGALALFLAAVGLYGVKAYLVSLRTREIGIRLAIGASPRDVLWMVMREGLTLTLGGLAIGLALALLIAKVVGSYLYQASPYDPVVFSVAPMVLAAASMLASYLPARRAMRVEPIIALRTE